MDSMLVNNLLSPAVLFFVLGVVAAMVKSDLKFPQPLTESLSLYLLAAIGLKGGIELSHHSFSSLLSPTLGTLALGVIIPVLTFGLTRLLGLDRYNAAALAATYGSVSIVTFGAAIAYLQQSGIGYETYMSAMVVLLESPAILISLIMLRMVRGEEDGSSALKVRSKQALGIVAQSPFAKGIGIDMAVLREGLFGKSVLLMLGALVIGMITGEKALPAVKPLFIDMYQSVLVLFLLGMGLSAGERMADLRKQGVKMISLAVLLPLAFGTLGVWIGDLCSLSVGGMTLMGVLAASSSYIAAPAAMRQSVPEANPSLYLGMSLGLTFPFNLAIGLPIYIELAKWIGS